MPIIDNPTVTPHQPYVANRGVIPGPVNAPIFLEPVGALAGFPTVPNLWIVVSNSDPNYGGAQVHFSTNGGSSYRLLGAILGNAITGELTAEWTAGLDPDTTHDLEVDLTESLGALPNYAEADKNLFLFPFWVEGGGGEDIPYELMTYETATLTAPHEYTLEASDGLRRGVFDAPLPAEGVTHASGSRFAFLDPTGAGIFKFSIQNLIGVELKFKFVALNKFRGGAQPLAGATVYTYTPVGYALP